MRSIIPIFFFTLFVIILYSLFNLGILKPVELIVEEQGPFELVYTEHVGPYHQINEKIIEVENWAKQNKLNCDITFGEFIDDPDIVDHDRLRSNAGCITQEFKVSLPDSYKSKKIVRRKYLVARFSGSPAIGPLKVYPKLKAAAEEQRYALDGPIIEVYEIKDKKLLTQYLYPIK